MVISFKTVYGPENEIGEARSDLGRGTLFFTSN